MQDAMFDTDVSCANGVANNGVTGFRRIGSVLTDESANIVPFNQEGDFFEWKTRIKDLVLPSGDVTTAVTLTLSVPTGIKILAFFNMSTFNAGGDLSSLDSTDLLISSPEYPALNIATMGNSYGSNSHNASQVKVWTNTRAQVRRRMSTKNSIGVDTTGWMDTRGKDS